MKEVVTIEAREGDKLEVYSNEKPTGQQITVPAGVTSVTIIMRDTEGFEAAQAERKAKLEARQARRGER